MKIEIKSDLPFSEYKLDLAFGRIKRFLNSDKKSHCYVFNDFEVIVKYKDGNVIATIKDKN